MKWKQISKLSVIQEGSNLCAVGKHQAKSLFSMAASQMRGYIPFNLSTLPPLEHHQNITSSFAAFFFLSVSEQRWAHLCFS